MTPEKDLIDKSREIISFKLTFDKRFKSNKALNLLLEKSKKFPLTTHSPFITNENFSRVSDKIKGGDCFRFELIPLLKTALPQMCLEFLEMFKASVFLVGAQGLAAIMQTDQEKLPLVKKIISLDKKDCLGKTDDGRKIIPFIKREIKCHVQDDKYYSCQASLFDVQNFGEPVGPDCYLLFAVRG